MFVIFSVQGSGYFHGVASVSREASSDMVSEFGQPELTNAYFITWVRRLVVLVNFVSHSLHLPS